jgi:hypothetical protein
VVHVWYMYMLNNNQFDFFLARVRAPTNYMPMLSPLHGTAWLSAHLLLLFSSSATTAGSQTTMAVISSR